MKKYSKFDAFSALVVLDTDTMSVDTLDSTWDIDRMYFIKEDGVFEIDGKTYDLKTNDILIKVYPAKKNEEQWFVVQHEGLSKYLADRHDEKEQFRNCEKSCCDECVGCICEEVA